MTARAVARSSLLARVGVRCVPKTRASKLDRATQKRDVDEVLL